MPAPKKNQYAAGNKGGRPPVFKSAKVLSKMVDKYFEYIKGEYKKTKVKVTGKDGKVSLTEVIECVREPEHASITGLTLYIGFASRSQLDEYEKKEEFKYTIARARTRVAYHYEQKLNTGSSFGAVFALKNMDGWKDKQHIDHTTNGQPISTTVIIEDPNQSGPAE